MTARDLRVELLETPEAVRSIVPQWEALVGKAVDPNLFFEPWMTLPLLRANGPFTWAAVRRSAPGGSGELIGLLPMRPTPGWKGRLLKGLQSWDYRQQALGDPLIAAGMEEIFWDAMLDWLDRSQRAGHFLRLVKIDEQSPSTRALFAVAKRLGRRCHVTRRFERALLPGRLDRASYKELFLSSKAKRRFAQAYRRLAALGPVTHERLDQRDRLDSWFDQFLALELRGWKGREGVALACDCAEAAAWRAILRASWERDRLDMHRLLLSRRPVSMMINIVGAGDRAYALLVAYDQEFAPYSPGALLELAYIDHILETKRIGSVDSCARGDHPLMNRLWSDRRAILSVTVERRAFWPILLGTADRSARRLLSALPPAWLPARWR